MTWSCQPLTAAQIAAYQTELAQLKAARLALVTGQTTLVRHGERETRFAPIDAGRLEGRIADLEGMLNLRSRGRARRVVFG